MTTTNDVIYRPRVCTECATCETPYIDCPICLMAEKVVDTKDGKEVTEES